jgi:hypothetical protein
MNLRRNYRLIIICLISAIAITAGGMLSQQPSYAVDKDDDVTAVNKLIDDFQTAYTAMKISDVQKLFHYKAVVGIDFNSNKSQEIMTLTEWLDSTREVFKGKPWVSDKLTNRQIEVLEKSMATVVCNYDYKDPGHHQVGVDIFTLMKIRGQWKIVSLIFSGDSTK